MTPLEVLQLIGFSTAAALHLWMGGLLLRRRHGLGRIEHVLMWLALAAGTWHGCNLLLALHSMLGLAGAGWEPALRVVNSLAVAGITLSYSLLLHAHLHLWADSRGRPLKPSERLRVYLSYLPVLFLPVALAKLWSGAYAPMFDKLNFLLLPFALWATYCLCLVAVTDFLIARSTARASERRLMRTMAASFVGIAAMVFVVYALRVGKGSALGEYLQTIANLGSLVPTALLAYHIYRYRYLELIIKESLIAATFAAVVLVVYLYGIRTAGMFITARYGVRAGVIESILILTLALVAAPLRRWLDQRFHQLFEREAALYRDVVTRIGGHAGRYTELPALLSQIEEKIVAALGLRKVRLLVFGGEAHAPDAAGTLVASDGGGNGSVVVVEPTGAGSDWEAQVAERVRAWGGAALEGDALVRQGGFQAAFPLRRESREVGLMLVDAAPDALTNDVMSVLEVLAGQVAIAVEDCRLVEENVRLERRLARGERLAALGQMAATVAHEVKNPLSAIKSIAQVMREDEKLNSEYARDLELIVGETDRLSRSVTQLLSFARGAPPAGSPVRAGELIEEVVNLARPEAAGREVVIDLSADADASAGASPTTFAAQELEGACAAALRDALTNMILNAVQASPRGGTVRVEARGAGEHLRVSVADEGAGVREDLHERIWEPFFTTKQRGTGLGLAIVRRRLEEGGGAARLAPRRADEGARFELSVPARRCTT